MSQATEKMAVDWMQYNFAALADGTLVELRVVCPDQEFDTLQSVLGSLLMHQLDFRTQKSGRTLKQNDVDKLVKSLVTVVNTLAEGHYLKRSSKEATQWL